METTEKNYTPVYIGVGIGLGIGLVICGVMYLITTYKQKRKIAQLKAVHETDKKTSLEAQSYSIKLENLKSRAEYAEKIKAQFAEQQAKSEPENTETITE